MKNISDVKIAMTLEFGENAGSKESGPLRSVDFALLKIGRIEFLEVHEIVIGLINIQLFLCFVMADNQFLLYNGEELLAKLETILIWFDYIAIIFMISLNWYGIGISKP